MRTIHKYILGTGDTEVEMPIGAEIKHVAIQGHSTICIWALIRSEAQTETRSFTIVGTGHEAPGPDVAQYVGTVQVDPFVWHVFERTKR